MSRSAFRFSILVLLIVLTACKGRERPARDLSPTPPSASAFTDQWLGQWNGPEGTYLFLAKSGDHYVITINSLDGRDMYQGVAAGDHIEFQRDGESESIRAGSGADTGMKWLLDKENCLVIQAGEGFCRG